MARIEYEDLTNSFKPVVGLVRKSSGKGTEEQRDSIPAQINKIKRFINDYKLELDDERIVGKWFDDDGIERKENGFSIREGSGLDIEREDIDDIVKSANAGGSNIMVVDDFSRLMRADLRNALLKLDFLTKFDIGIVIVEEGPRVYEPQRPSHFSELAQMAEDAHRFSARTSRNTIRGISHRAEEMLTPLLEGYGYRINSVKDRKRVIEWSVVGMEDELKVIKESIDRYINGDTKISIINWFNSVTGRNISQQNLERLITDKKWMGTYQRFKFKAGKIHSVGRNGTAVEYQRFVSKHDKSKNYKSIMEPQDESVTISFSLEDQKRMGKDVGMDSIAIISEDEHYKVMERFNKRDKRNRVENIKHPFGGLVYCADCGHKMKSQKRNKNKEVHYACGEYQITREICKIRKSIKEEELGRIVMENYLDSLMFDTVPIIERLKEKRKLLGASEQYLSIIRKRDNWIRRRKRLIDEGKEDGFDYRECTEEIEKMDRKLEFEKENKTAVVVDEHSKWTMGRLLNMENPDLKEVIEESIALSEEWKQNPFVPSYELVRAILERVSISFGTVPMKYGLEGKLKAVPATVRVTYKTGSSYEIPLDAPQDYLG